MCFTKYLVLNFKLVRVMNLRSMRQFLHDKLALFTINMTEELSQKIVTLLFGMYLVHSSTLTATAKSSRYSMLGSYCLMKSGSHFLYTHLFSKISQNPRFSALVASEKKQISSAVTVLALKSIIGLVTTSSSCRNSIQT